MAQGGMPLKPPVGDIDRAVSLRAVQARDQFQSRTPASTTHPESISGGKSPIENPDTSYAARAREGGAETERRRQEAMLKTEEAFTGAPATPSATPREPEPTEEPGEETRARPEPTPTETTEEAVIDQQAKESAAYEAESARLSADAERRRQLQQNWMDAQARRNADARGRFNADMYKAMTMTSGMASCTGVGYVIYFISSNVRLFRLFFSKKNGAVPKPTLPQIFVTLWSNFMACSLGTPYLFFCCTALAVCAGFFLGIALIVDLFS